MFLEFCLSCVLILLVYCHYIQKSKSAPPGPFALPIVGNILQLAARNQKHSYIALDKLAQEYGDVMTVRFGSRDTVVLSSYEALKEIMEEVECRPGRIWNKAADNRSFHKRLGMLFLDGNAWDDQREFTIRHLIDVDGKQNMMEVMIHAELVEVMERIRQYMGDGYQTVLPIHNIFKKSLLNILWAYIGGERYEHNDKNLNQLRKLLDDLFKSCSLGSGISNMLPLFQKFSSGSEMEQLNAFNAVYNFLQKIIQNKKKEKSNGPGKSFLDIYLEEIEHNSNSHFTEDELITICMDLLMAGSESTSNTLGFAILYMILNPHVQKRVHEEIVNIVGKDRSPRMDDRENLSYTEAVLMEVQRIANVTPLTPRHRLLKPVSLRNYKISQGTVIFANLYSIHMDKTHWIDPKVFRPARFLRADGKICHDEHLIPFGVGKRRCSGEPLAKMSLFLYFTTLMQNFLFETVPGHLNPTTEPVPGFTLSPQQFHSVISRRNSD